MGGLGPAKRFLASDRGHNRCCTALRNCVAGLQEAWKPGHLGRLIWDDSLIRGGSLRTHSGPTQGSRRAHAELTQDSLDLHKTHQRLTRTHTVLTQDSPRTHLGLTQDLLGAHPGLIHGGSLRMIQSGQLTGLTQDSSLRWLAQDISLETA